MDLIFWLKFRILKPKDKSIQGLMVRIYLSLRIFIFIFKI
jgi:hypothetical protein